MNLQQKKARLIEIKNELDALSAERMLLKQQIAEEESAIKVGDQVEWEWGRGWRRGIVSEIRSGFMGKPEYIVDTILKGGKPGAKAKISWHMTVRPFKSVE